LDVYKTAYQLAMKYSRLVRPSPDEERFALTAKLGARRARFA
jgi:hypothetical protein